MFKNGKTSWQFKWNAFTTPHSTMGVSRHRLSIWYFVHASLACCVGVVLKNFNRTNIWIHRDVYPTTQRNVVCLKTSSTTRPFGFNMQRVSKPPKPKDFVGGVCGNWLVFIGFSEWTFILQWPSQDPGTRSREKAQKKFQNNFQLVFLFWDIPGSWEPI